jgi:hypothetical protein
MRVRYVLSALVALNVGIAQATICAPGVTSSVIEAFRKAVTDGSRRVHGVARCMECLTGGACETLQNLEKNAAYMDQSRTTAKGGK